MYTRLHIFIMEKNQPLPNQKTFLIWYIGSSHPKVYCRYWYVHRDVRVYYYTSLPHRNSRGRGKLYIVYQGWPAIRESRAAQYIMKNNAKSIEKGIICERSKKVIGLVTPVIRKYILFNIVLRASTHCNDIYIYLSRALRRKHHVDNFNWSDAARAIVRT